MDLPEVLPSFNTRPYNHLLHSLRKNDITVVDLISLDPLQIAKRCPLPLLDVQHLAAEVIEALQTKLEVSNVRQSTSDELLASPVPSMDESESSTPQPDFISTLDIEIDETLGGGFPAGHITEVVGESAVGKTQFVLSLLLSAQLGPPRGLGKSVIYISTEDELNTRRLEQMLLDNPTYQGLPLHERPSFDQIHSMTVHDLLAQQSIIERHLPHAIEQYNVGLMVIDSITANFRAHHSSSSSSSLSSRAADLLRLGSALRSLAQQYGVAVVVTNQVSDRFTGNVAGEGIFRPSSPVPSSMPASQSSSLSVRNTKIALDHQQYFFTGWGMESDDIQEEPKNPALGLIWANQLSARIVLKVGRDEKRHLGATGKRRRFLSLVFASLAAPSSKPLEYAIEGHGISHLVQTLSSRADVPLEEQFWNDLVDEDFP